MRMERSSGDVPPGEIFQVPSPRAETATGSSQPHSGAGGPQQRILLRPSFRFRFVQDKYSRPLSTSRPRTSPSTSTSQVRRPARRGGWGRVVCPGSPASLLAAPPRPCPRRDGVPAAALLQAQVLGAAAAAPQLHRAPPLQTLFCEERVGYNWAYNTMLTKTWLLSATGARGSPTGC